tara:strand:- start:91 stop:336 length:246 start_codon:yes stop_codon:yes gene_type:complete
LQGCLLTQLLQAPIHAAWRPTQLPCQLALTKALVHHAAQQELIIRAVGLDPTLQFRFRQARFWGGAPIDRLEGHAIASGIK